MSKEIKFTVRNDGGDIVYIPELSDEGFIDSLIHAFKIDVNNLPSSTDFIINQWGNNRLMKAFVVFYYKKYNENIDLRIFSKKYREIYENEFLNMLKFNNLN